MTFSLASSTDTQEDVNAAAGIKPAEPEAKKSETPADDKSKTGSDSGTEHPADEKKDESKSAAESGTAEVEEEEDEVEGEEGEEEEAEEEEKPEGEKKPEVKKKSGGFSKRIDRLTKEKSEVEKKLAHALGQLAERPAAKAEEVKKADSDPEPNAKDFTEHEKYIAALARWNARQENRSIREQEHREAVQERVRETFNNWHNKAIPAARAAHEDFDEVVGRSAEIPESVKVTIMELGEAGTDVAYHLGQHPELCEELMGMSDARAVARIGRLEAKLHPDVDEKETPKPPEKKIPVSKAPEPAKLVKATATTAAKDPNEMTHAEYREWRKKNSGGRFR